MTCPLFVELCAGTAALSLRLHTRGARPPVSRMGAKTGYADAILRVLGLAPGARAAHYLWCEPDPGVRLLLEAYRDADLARAAAAIIRGWADEEPRALWERLRAEGPPVLPATGPEVARWQVLSAWAFRQGEPASGFVASAAHDQPGRPGGRQSAESMSNSVSRAPTLPATIAPDARTVDPREVARWAVLRVRTMPQASPGNDGDFLPMVAPSGTTRYQLDTPSAALSRAPTLPATIAPDARTVDPREVARWVVTGQWAYQAGNPSTGYAPRGEPRLWSDGYVKTQRGILPMAEGVARALTLPATIHPDARTVDPREVARWAWVQRRTHPGNERSFLHQVPVKPVANPARQGLRWTHEQPAPLFEALPVIEATIVDNAGIIEPGPDLPPGTVAYMDPPYVGTTGYGHDLPRADVVALARRWAAAGATVAISEAEPIADLTAEGWHAVRVDGERRGQKRTFSRQQAEWLTMNRPPAWTPPEQRGLFA